MDIRAEIAARVDKLSPDRQEQVLRFVSSLSRAMPKGENGEALRQFSGSLDSTSAREMMQAIEEEFERADAGEW
jgi:hypothetical protein